MPGIRRAVLAAAVLAVACCGGCGGPASAGPSVAVPTSFAPPAPAGDHRRGGERGGAAPSATGLPAGWPSGVPVPSGVLVGSTSGSGRWTILLVEPGPAPDVQRSTVAFYQASGFVMDADQVLRRGAYAVTVAAENRDHSAAETNLSIGVVQH